MANKYGPKINDNGLVLCLDAASKKTYPTDGLDVEYLIVAGGGGGGSRDAGAGGAGGLLTGVGNVNIATGSYSVVVGAGGAAGVGGTSGSVNGNDSSFLGTTSTGGGRGGQYPTNLASTGGSGGGGYNNAAGANGTAGQGNKGGDGNTPNSNYNGGGGGGAGGEGGDSLSDGVSGGDGGIGRYFGDKYGTSLGDDGWFAGGGGAGGEQGGSTDGTGGKGGGGDGHATAADDGQANTGGGGGSNRSSTTGLVAGNGGSGVVIIRYKGSQKASGGDSIFNYRGFTVHVFTSSGTFTVGDRVGGLSTSKIVGTLNFMDSTNYSSANRGYFSFNGSDEYITFPLNNPSGDWVHSIVFWMYLNSDQSAISSRVDPFQIGSVNGYSQYSAVDISNNNFYWYFYSNDTRINTNIFSGQQWYHIGLTYSGGGATTSTKKFYLNSVYIPWNVTSGAVYGNNLAIAGNTTLTIGRDSPRTTAYFPGRIASFQIYNNDLSESEILQNYNATKGRFGL